jgi:hypothetical protein
MLGDSVAARGLLNCLSALALHRTLTCNDIFYICDIDCNAIAYRFCCKLWHQAFYKVAITLNPTLQTITAYVV